MNMYIKKHLERLISIPSVSSDQDMCAAAINYIAKSFASSNLSIQRFEKDGVYSICVSQQEVLDFDLLFLGHLDVVPAQRKLFTPRTCDGWMYGRGAADMKGSCAVMLELFLRHGEDTEFAKCGLIFTTDEELGGERGIAYLVNELGLKARTVVNPDGPDGFPAFTPCSGEKGIISVILDATGKTAHSSRPWLGENALDKLLKDVEAVKSCFEYTKSDNDWRTSCNLSRLRGGESLNSVPENARAEFDLRYPSIEERDEVLRGIDAVVKHSEVSIVNRAEPMLVDPSSKVARLLLLTLQRHGYDREFVRECGGSDARWFTPQGSHVVMLLPECSEFHIEGERVSLSSLDSFLTFLQDFAREHSTLYR